MAKNIQEEIDAEIVWDICKQWKEEANLSWTEFLEQIGKNDDGIRHLCETEINDRMKRCSGDVICHICGKTYYKHPKEMRVIGWGNEPFLVRLCNGWLGKL